MPEKPPLTQRLKTMFETYGTLAIVVYLVIYALTWAGFAAAGFIGVGHSETATGTAGIIGAAWVAAKLTQPIRIGATLVLTPVVAKVRARFRPPAAQ
jgi:phosphate/sulfate permease